MGSDSCGQNSPFCTVADNTFAPGQGKLCFGTFPSSWQSLSSSNPPIPGSMHEIRPSKAFSSGSRRPYSFGPRPTVRQRRPPPAYRQGSAPPPRAFPQRRTNKYPRRSPAGKMMQGPLGLVVRFLLWVADGLQEVPSSNLGVAQR